MATMQELVDAYNKLSSKKVKTFKNIAQGEERVSELYSKFPPEKSFKAVRIGGQVQEFGTVCTRKEAIENGYVLYWNGRECDNGHVSVRYSKSGHCKKCYQLFRAEEIPQSEISKDNLKEKTNDIKMARIKHKTTGDKTRRNATKKGNLRGDS